MSPRDSGEAVAETSTRQALFPIDMAMADYDRTRPLIDGRVKAEGLALNISTAPIGEFCHRPVYEDFHVAEMSFSWYVAARCRGEPVVAFPVFPLRMAVLSYMFVRADSPITKPSDLIGKRIGAPGYRYTVNLWLRGILRDHYGFTPDQAHWVTCEEEGAGFVVPAGIKVEVAPGKNAARMLEDGEVDAIFTPGVPESIRRGETKLRRLFPDAQAEMQAHVRRTGINPITHVMVMEQSLSEREPWIAESLFRSFTEAQAVSDDFNSDPKRLTFPDAVFFLEQQRAAYGAHPYVHGIEPNRKIIETFLRYAHDQGYIERKLAIEDLFARNTLSL